MQGPPQEAAKETDFKRCDENLQAACDSRSHTGLPWLDVNELVLGSEKEPQAACNYS